MSERPAIIKSKVTQDVANESLLTSKFIALQLKTKLQEKILLRKGDDIFFEFFPDMFLSKNTENTTKRITQKQKLFRTDIQALMM